MIRFLNKIAQEGILIDFVDGKLKLFTENETLDPDLLNEIKAKKEDIIAYLSENLSSGISNNHYSEIPVASHADDFMASSAQIRMWILSRFEESNISSNMPYSLTFKGNMENLEKAVLSVIERHESLRTVFFANTEGAVRQSIKSFRELAFKTDYRDFSNAAEPEKLIQEYLNQDICKPFDLESGPLLRTAILQTSADTCTFYYVLHHIICDGWSLGVLKNDILAYYNFYNEGMELQLPELRIQYKDYTLWQQEKSGIHELRNHRKYWLEKLSGELPAVTLPFQKTRPKIKSYQGSNLSTWISPELTTALKLFCTGQDGSLFVGLLALWNVLIFRYTAQKDIIIGTPVAGRNHPDLENQIGFYLNLLPLRNQVDPQEDFLSFYEKVKKAVLSDFEYQSYPFDHLIADLNLIKDTGRSPLFDVLLILQNTAGEITGTTQDTIDFQDRIMPKKEVSIPKYDLDIEFKETGGGLFFSVNYNTDLFDTEQIKTLIAHYMQLMSVLLKYPAQQIGTADFLTGLQKNTLLYSFNNTLVKYAEEKTVVDLFSAQVLKHPDRVAIVFENTTITYRELDESSNQLAHYLQENYAVGPNDIVGIKLNRTEWMIISMLGILKAGGAYVAIDTNYPEQRIEYIKKDCNCKVCIDSDELRRFASKQELYAKQALYSACSLKDLAYVLYTSGSTGIPKGVMVTLENLMSFLVNLDGPFHFSQLKSFGLSTSLTFDLSILEILGALCTGKEAHLFSDEELQDPYLFLERLATGKIEGMLTTPSRLMQLYELTAHLPAGLKVLIAGGEPLSTVLFDKLRKEPFISLNAYGPTEATIYSTLFNLKDGIKPLIGKPLANEQIYILNEEQQLQPLNVSGEIYIGGRGVAKGYLGRAELTAEKFIANPFKAGEYLYRTGDLGRWLPDGNIEFRGRIDDQVKIRGHRIELKEVEHWLLMNPQLIDAVVINIKSSSGMEELAAYIVAAAEIDIQMIREYLLTCLPEYMIPAYFIQIDKIPLTISGKTDKKNLPGPSGVLSHQGTTYMPPETANEKALITVCQDILKIKQIGINNSFFNLGGDSIKSIQIVSRLKQNGYALKLADILHTPVLRDIAARMTKISILQKEISPDQLPVISAVENNKVTHLTEECQLEFAVLSNYNFVNTQKPNLIVFHEGTGEILGYRHLFDGLKSHFNIWAFKFDKAICSPTAVNPMEMAALYAKTILEKFGDPDQIQLLGWSYGGYIAYLVTNYFEQQAKAPDRLIMIDSPNYINPDYNGDYQKEYFTADYQLSIELERTLILDICPQLDISDLAEIQEIDLFWKEIEKKVALRHYDFIIPEFWKDYFQKVYPGTDLAHCIEKINQLRTIGLNIPTPHHDPVEQTKLIYFKAKNSDKEHGLFWKELTKSPFREEEVTGGHGSMMTPPHIEQIIATLTKF